ncbi:23154_t:CDS:1, partial [Gigaspora margarita]
FENIYLRTYYSLSTIEHSNNKTIINTDNNLATIEDHADDFFEYAARQSRNSENNPLYEVNQYFNKPIAVRTTNILVWWKCNIGRFPTLFRMAQDFLAIPATSIKSEQMFSCTGHVIDDSRTLLDPSTITALMCQRNWLEVGEQFGWNL